MSELGRRSVNSRRHAPRASRSSPRSRGGSPNLSGRPRVSWAARAIDVGRRSLSMSAGTVTVAIPVHNAGTDLANVLSSVRAQKISREVELLVVDSGSTDGSVEVVRSHG